MIAVAMTKMVACSAIAMAGTIATHHCRVRHHRSAVAMTQTPMTISVLPMCDQTMVTLFQSGVRSLARSALRPLSLWLSDFSGPRSSSPKPTITSQMTMPGTMARSSRPRAACPALGLEDPSRRVTSGPFAHDRGADAPPVAEPRREREGQREDDPSHGV